MKHFHRSFIRHSKITNASLSQNWHVQTSLLVIMQEMWVWFFNIAMKFFSLVSAKTYYLSTSFQVQYQSEHFLDKNKDYVVPEHQEMLSSSKCSFVSGLFPPLSEESAKSSKFSSIGSRFKVYKIWFFILSVSDRPYLNPKVRRLILLYLFVQLQLQQLMDTLNLTEPHYIRCVKPNTQLKPFIFEHMNVIQQLRSGVSLSSVIFSE